MNRIEFIDESGKTLAVGSGPALAKSLAGDSLLPTKVVLVGEDGKVQGAGFGAEQMLKSQSTVAAIRASVPKRQSISQMRKAVDALENRLAGMRRATKAEKALRTVERIFRGGR